MSNEKAGTTGTKISNKKHIIVGIVITLVMAIAALIEPAFFRTLELKLLDLRFSIRNELSHSNLITIVDIDDRSISKLGKWPWKRSIFASLLDQLNEAGAKVIAFDIYFQKDDSKPIDEDEIIFVNKIAETGNVILPIYFNLNKQELVNRDMPPDVTFSFPQTINMDELDQYAIIKGYDLFSSSKDLNLAAFGIGHINMIPDPDGVTRKEITVIEYQDNYFPSLAFKVVQRYYADTQNLLELDGMKGISVGEKFIHVTPTTMDGAMVWGTKNINYRGGYRAFSYYSVIDVLEKRYPNNAFLDKVVLVGTTSPGLFDTLATPLANVFPGVERHANVIDNILNEDFITRPYYSEILMLLFCIAFGLIITFVFPKLNTAPQIITLLCLTAGYSIFSHLLFSKYAIWINLLFPVLTLWAVALPILFLLLSETKREHAETKEESLEATKMLGLSFMEKGMLEMAYDNLAKLPLTPENMRILYSLANEFVRKRKNSLATQIYRDLYRMDKHFEDVAVRLNELGVSIIEEPEKVVRKGTTFVEDTSKSDQTTALQEGQTLGRYEVLKILGQGAMGVVYLCKDPTLERLVALKTFKFSEFADAEELVKIKSNFIREAKLAGKLNHPNIVTIFDAGEDWDLSYIAMEVIEGEELKEYCTPGNLLSPGEVINNIITIAKALDYAHKIGVIHRDIKPANIMITKDGITKITDFGIALIKGEIASIAGTPSYMAPEQFLGESVDGRTDLYALGIIFFEMLTGRKPFHASDIASLKDKILNQPVSDSVRKSIPGSSDIHRVIEKLLEKEKDARYANGEELALELQDIETGQLHTPALSEDKTEISAQNRTIHEEATISLEEETILDEALIETTDDEQTILDQDATIKDKD